MRPPRPEPPRERAERESSGFGFPNWSGNERQRLVHSWPPKAAIRFHSPHTIILTESAQPADLRVFVHIGQSFLGSAKEGLPVRIAVTLHQHSISTPAC